MATEQNTPGAMPETTEIGRDAQPAEREAESSEGYKKALNAERRLREAAERHAKTLESEREALRTQELEAKGQYDKALEKHKAESAARIAAAENFALMSGLKQIAAQFVHPEAIDDLLQLKRADFALHDGNIVASGFDSPDDYFAALAKAKPIYAKPVASTPSLRGTMPSGGLAQPDISKMTPAQKMTFGRLKK